MPIYGQHNGAPSSSGDEDMTVGYATSEGLPLDSLIIYALVTFISLTTLAISGTVFTTIQEAIKPSEATKPKLYYHYWSAVALTIATMCFTLVEKFDLTILMIACSSGFILFLSLLKRLTVPLTILIPTNPCKFIWTCLLTMIGLSSTFTLIFYVVYALPTIILMYHLDAIRTLIKVPFIIGAVSVIVALGSVVLHQLEKVIVMYVVMGCKKLYHCLSGPESNESEQPLKYCRCCRILSSLFNYDNVIKQIMLEKQYDIKYYEKSTEKIFSWHKYYEKSAEKIFSRRKFLLCTIFLFDFFKLFASVMALVIFAYGVLALADIVFQESSNIDATINNVLLALIPTVAVYAGAWLGRGVIFDLKEDLKLNSKENEQDRLIKALKDLTEQMEKNMRHEGSRNDAERGEGGGEGGETRGEERREGGGETRREERREGGGEEGMREDSSTMVDLTNMPLLKLPPS